MNRCEWRWRRAGGVELVCSAGLSFPPSFLLSFLTLASGQEASVTQQHLLRWLSFLPECRGSVPTPTPRFVWPHCLLP